MKEYMYTKTLGIIVGILAIFAGIGFGILSLIGIGLSKAWNTGNAVDSSPIIILIIFLVIGLITSIGAFKLKRKVLSHFYIGFCIMLGIGFLAAFLISFGSLGIKNEIFILCIGIIYLGLGYLAKKKK